MFQWRIKQGSKRPFTHIDFSDDRVIHSASIVDDDATVEVANAGKRKFSFHLSNFDSEFPRNLKLKIGYDLGSAKSQVAYFDVIVVPTTARF